MAGAPRADEYGRSHPGPADTLLLIEVSDTSLDYDINIKLPLHARHNVPEVWIVDLQHSELHYFRSPRDARYPDHASTREPGVTGIVALPGIEVDLSKLFQR